MDIHLAEERMMCVLNLLEHPDSLINHTIKKKVMVIPKMVTSPYEIDFGSISTAARITCSYYTYTLLIFNYGPCKAFVRCEKNHKNLEKVGITIDFKEKIMDVGEVLPIYIKLRPVLSDSKLCYTKNISANAYFLVSFNSSFSNKFIIKHFFLQCITFLCTEHKIHKVNFFYNP